MDKEVLKTGAKILADMVERKPDQQVDTFRKSGFDKAKGNLEQIMKSLTGSRLHLKRQRKQKMSPVYHMTSKSINKFGR